MTDLQIRQLLEDNARTRKEVLAGIRDIHETVSAHERRLTDHDGRLTELERARHRHSDYYRQTQQSFAEIHIDEEKLETKQEELKKSFFELVATPRNTVIGFIIVTFREDIRALLSPAFQFIRGLIF